MGYLHHKERASLRIHCTLCNRDFQDAGGLAMHTAAKHGSSKQTEETKTSHFKTIRNWGIGLGALLLLGWLFASLIPNYTVPDLNVALDELDVSSIPPGAVHWHPRLTIIINDTSVPLLENLGHTQGKKIDTYLSGMGMAPLHTHTEKDGTIHLENNNPRSRPETVTLGYFFYVWDVPFNATCIFEYCTDKGNLTLVVNDKENLLFQNYVMNDKDTITIRYTPF